MGLVDLVCEECSGRIKDKQHVVVVSEGYYDAYAEDIRFEPYTAVYYHKECFEKRVKTK